MGLPAGRVYDAADDDQLALIHANEHQIIRLVAPAGSGKTQTIIHRVLQLSSPKILKILTFGLLPAHGRHRRRPVTRKAAGKQAEVPGTFGPDSVSRADNIATASETVASESTVVAGSVFRRFYRLSDRRNRRRWVLSAFVWHAGGLGILDVDGYPSW
jgi:hypothetical protein